MAKKYERYGPWSSPVSKMSAKVPKGWRQITEGTISEDHKYWDPGAKRFETAGWSAYVGYSVKKFSCVIEKVPERPKKEMISRGTPSKDRKAILKARKNKNPVKKIPIYTPEEFKIAIQRYI